MASSHWSQERGAAQCPPQTPRADPTNTLILDFQPPELRENTFLPFEGIHFWPLLWQPQETDTPLFHS